MQRFTWLGRRITGCLGVLVIAACAPAVDAPAPVTSSQLAMGTEIRVTVWTNAPGEAAVATARVFAEFQRLENLLSVWREGSDVLRLNAAAGGDAVFVAPETLEVLQLARRYGELSGGKFDVTFGALSDVWKFDHDQDDVLPAAEAIGQRLPLVAWEDLELDTLAGTARLRRTGMKVHLGGIGKGYAVDRAAAMLREHGFSDFLIQAGGDLYVGGRPGGRLWRLGVQDPRGAPDDPFAVVELSDATFSTSGDYERFFMHEGRRYHHLLDPDTGLPAAGNRSATIVADSAAEADALSTAAFILGPQAGFELIERLPGVEGVIVTATNEVRISSGLKDRLRVLRAPTDAP